MRGLVQSKRDLREVFRRAAGAAANKRDRRHGDPLVDDRDPVVCGDLFSYLYEVFRALIYFVINLLPEYLQIRK